MLDRSFAPNDQYDDDDTVDVKRTNKSPPAHLKIKVNNRYLANEALSNMAPEHLKFSDPSVIASFKSRKNAANAGPTARHSSLGKYKLGKIAGTKG